MSTNTTVKNVEASRRRTRGQCIGSFLMYDFVCGWTFISSVALVIVLLM